eukprot:UN21125
MCRFEKHQISDLRSFKQQIGDLSQRQCFRLMIMILDTYWK